MADDVAIIGGGLSGLMCGLLLGDLGYNVSIFEKRTHAEICDPYEGTKKPGRSMSMDISSRGIHALERVGIMEDILKKSVPMRDKIFHFSDGQTLSIPYGRNEAEQILTVSRTDLYLALMMATERLPNLSVNFGYDLIELDFSLRSLTFMTDRGEKIVLATDKVIGADGINSKVRDFCHQRGTHSFTRELFPHRYKELSIPKEQAQELNLQAMHLWARQEFMLVAQPNFDRSFTCALLLTESMFDGIDQSGSINDFFIKHFPDAHRIMPNLKVEYQSNPIGTLNVIKSTGWSYEAWVLMIGDAVHGMTPFFGQGVNCCFEDCTNLADLLQQNGLNWGATLTAFDRKRPTEANAINEMSMMNYPELFESPDLEKIFFERQLENLLTKEFSSDYRSYHNLVCFDRVPYHVVKAIRTLQTELLAKVYNETRNIKKIDRIRLKTHIDNYKAKLANENGGTYEEHRAGA